MRKSQLGWFDTPFRTGTDHQASTAGRRPIPVTAPPRPEDRRLRHHLGRDMAETSYGKDVRQKLISTWPPGSFDVPSADIWCDRWRKPVRLLAGRVFVRTFRLGYDVTYAKESGP